MHCASNPSKAVRPARRDVLVEFPVAGGQASGMNHVRVIAYFDSLGRVISVPASHNHAARAKVIIDNARYGEHKPMVDVDVVVHFANNDFDGDSFGVALALADKRARYDMAGMTGRLVATGIVGPQGEVTAVDAFPAKVAYLAQLLKAGDLFVYPTSNATGTVQAALQRLRQQGVVLRSIERLAQVRDLWNHRVQQPGTPLKTEEDTIMVERIDGIEETKAFEQLGILVLDGSGSMSEPGSSDQPKAEEINQAVRGLISRLRNSRHRNNFYLAVVTYDHQVNPGCLAPTPVTQVDDTADYNPLKGHGGETAIGDALAGAYAVAEAFLEGQSTAPRSVVIVVMSDGHNNRGPNPVEVAERLKQSGKRITVCAAGYGKDRGLDEMTLKRLVSEPQGYKFTMNTNELRDFFEASISQVRG
jgi:uncharacterized protein YegL